MNPDHHRSPRAIERRRPDIEKKAIFAVALLRSQRCNLCERARRHRVLRCAWTEARGRPHATPGPWFFGQHPATRADRWRRKWHTLEDEQSALLFAFEFTVTSGDDCVHRQTSMSGPDSLIDRS